MRKAINETTPNLDSDGIPVVFNQWCPRCSKWQNHFKTIQLEFFDGEDIETLFCCKGCGTAIQTVWKKEEEEE